MTWTRERGYQHRADSVHRLTPSWMRTASPGGSRRRRAIWSRTRGSRHPRSNMAASIGVGIELVAQPVDQASDLVRPDLDDHVGVERRSRLPAQGARQRTTDRVRDATPIEDRGDCQRDLDQIVSHARRLERQSDADRRGEPARGPASAAQGARRSRSRWQLDDAGGGPPGPGRARSGPLPRRAAPVAPKTSSAMRSPAAARHDGSYPPRARPKARHHGSQGWIRAPAED